mmetsp:Transcript_7127/g.11362  ORF Transcript_7127/g.11362 Transcript_7127/m.11362 type:complete len:82 (-) Transcript_7127:218-463(-)
MKMLEDNCKLVPCEELKSYIDDLQAKGTCSAASDCLHLAFSVDLSYVQKMLDRWKQKFRICLSSHVTVAASNNLRTLQAVP